MQRFKQFLCKLFGHKWQPYHDQNNEPYIVTTFGARRCTRCGETTGYLLTKNIPVSPQEINDYVQEIKKKHDGLCNATSKNKNSQGE